MYLKKNAKIYGKKVFVNNGQKIPVMILTKIGQKLRMFSIFSYGYS